jgi:hypothetical protein
MPNKLVSCIAISREQADQITHQIKAVNFSGNNISLRFADQEMPAILPARIKRGAERACAGAPLWGC